MATDEVLLLWYMFTGILHTKAATTGYLKALLTSKRQALSRKDHQRRAGRIRRSGGLGNLRTEMLSLDSAVEGKVVHQAGGSYLAQRLRVSP